VNRIFRWMVGSFFAPVTSSRGAVASSLGFVLGLVPLYGAKLPLLFVLSIIFRLNILAIMLGMVLPIFIPFIRHLAFLCSHFLEGYSFSLDSIKFWLFSSHRHYPGAFSQLIVGITASAFGFLSYPLFHWFYNSGIKKGETHQEHIFLDPTKQRWSIIKRMSFGFIALSLVISILFIESINTNPLFPNLQLKSTHSRVILPIFKKIRDETSVKLLKYQEKKHPDYQLDFKKHSKIKKNQQTGKQEVYGFYVNWDENSKASLKQNIRSISVLVPEWLHITHDLTFTKETDLEVASIAKAHKVKILPLINNYINNNWDGDTLHRLFTAPGAENQFITNMLVYVKTNGFSGINIDFEGIKPADKNNLTHFVQNVSAKFHQQGLTVTMDVPPDDKTFDYSALANVADTMIVMLYDENSTMQPPGPIASSNWVNQSLNNLNIPSNKLVVSLGSYGYDWVENSRQPAETLTFGDIMDMGLDTNLDIQWDKKAGNPYLRYKENGDNHIIWFLDAATFHNQLKAVVNSGSKGIAIWRLGSEDPSIWKLLNHPDKKPGLILKHLTNPNPVNYTGAGEVLKIVSSKVEGKRSVESDSNGIITNEVYNQFPKPFEVVRYGKPKTKEVVLSFDDGPDPVYTPKVLDILDHYHIKGTFFMVGENAELHPELIERMYKEGHEIGSHTFTHPNIASISPIRTKMELNANQRLFEEITGHSMTLFRPPYVADAEPSTTNELLPILRAQDMGYTMVGELIDPSDWQRPPSNEIVRRVLSQLHNGNVILLHDAGGNRSNTVKALPIIIKDLKEQGYTFTTIAHLIKKSHAEIMPAASKELPYLIYDKAVFNIMQGWHDGVSVLFFSAIIIGIIRLAFLVYMSRRQVKRYKEIPIDPTFTPFVSVVIAAYNEEKVIKKTVDSILASDYPAFEVLVVDDGSKDGTSAVIREAYLNNPLVRLISKGNGGKSSAVNLGFKEAKGEIVVALDADTLIAENAISLLVRHFKNEQVSAVSGNVKVGNKGNLLTNWQHIEYVTGFNLERRAFAELNCITVVPGAIGAWRKTAVEVAGYFKEDTLAEDTDITLTLLRQGHKIEFEEKAYAYTEVPEDIKSLAKQRYRWTYGTLQCLWKHRESLFSKEHSSLGYIGLPNMWLYQYIYQSLSPIADILFIFALLSGHSGKTIIGFIVFYSLDFLTALYSFRLEKENPKPLIHLFLQRILYKQLMTYVVIKSILSAIKGVAVGWNKLKRNGNVIQKLNNKE
jgi:peptidoglycan-N-acetylglucosamine deacetylase